MVITQVMIQKIFLILFVGFFALTVSPAFAQHHSGSVAPPIDFGGMIVALTSFLSPEDFSADETKSANLSIRFFDSESNTNIKSVTYRVQIYQNDNLVANEYFFDEDGDLNIEVRPTTGCKEQNLWKCTKYFGEKHAIAGAYYARGDSRPIIQGPVFDKSGQYHLKVSIVGATNPKTMTTSDLLFETFLTLPQKDTFQIKTANAQEFPVLIKTYDGKILNFNFDESANKITYEIPINLAHNDHTSNFKQIISLEKDFSVFKQGYDVEVYAQGIKLSESSYEFDVTSPNENLIKIDIPHEELLLLGEKQSSTNENNLKIEISPGSKTVLNQINFKFENQFTAKATWDSKLDAGTKIPFTFSFFDENNKLIKNSLFAYSLTDSSGKEIWSNIGTNQSYLGILAPSGIVNESILIPKEDQYRLKLILTGQNSQNFETFYTATSELSISSSDRVETSQTAVIPSWIKNSAGWWAEGIIGDDEFIQSIQFLIKERLLFVPISTVESTQSQEIPLWIKNNAGWWSEGLISESDFVKGLEFLISKGLIKIN